VPVVCATATLVATAVAGCGGGGAAGNGVAKKSPSDILAAAAGAMNGLKSVHVAGSLVESGTTIGLDMDLVAGTGARGQISENGLSFKFVTLGRTIYIDGDKSFWNHFAGAAGAQLLQGKWFRAPITTGQFAQFSALTDIHQLVGSVVANHGSLAKGQTGAVDGQQTVALRDTTQGGTLYVASTGAPYMIELTRSGTSGGRVVFDHFNQPVSLSAPAGSIDASALSAS
jgi:hypothetical protein